MKDKLIELLTNTPPTRLKAVGRLQGKTYTTASRMADHLLANGVIVLPCKVGDKVWFLNTYSSIAMRRNAVYEAKVVRMYVEKDNILCLSIQVKNEMGTTEYPRITEIGKTVFFTRKEQKRHLRKGADNEQRETD